MYICVYLKFYLYVYVYKYMYIHMCVCVWMYFFISLSIYEFICGKKLVYLPLYLHGLWTRRALSSGKGRSTASAVGP